MTFPTKIKSNFTRVLMGTALTISASVMVNAGESKAAECNIINLASCNLLQTGDKKLLNLNLNGYAPGADDKINFTGSGIGLYVVSFNFGNPVALNNSFSYDVMIIGTDTFKDVGSDSDTNVIPGSTSTSSQTITGITLPQVSFNGSGVPMEDFSPTNLQMINVSIGTATTGGATFNNFSTKFFQRSAPTQRVPGPLPLLGIGAAFGFSRKLRNRIKFSA